MKIHLLCLIGAVISFLMFITMLPGLSTEPIHIKLLSVGILMISFMFAMLALKEEELK